MGWGLMTCAAGLLAAASVAPAEAGEGADALRRNLYGGTVAAGIAELEPMAAAGDAEAKFGIGVLQMVGAIEGFGRGLYRHGASAPDTAGFAVLFLPVEPNPNPEPLDYAKFRALLDEVVTGMDAAHETLLAASTMGEFVVPLDVLEARVDTNGDGVASDRERIGGFLPNPGDGSATIMAPSAQPGPPPKVGDKGRSAGPPTPAAEQYSQSTIGFDNADAIWLAGYSQIVAIQFDLLLAHDFSEMFNAVFHRFFPKAGLPMQEALANSSLFLDPASDPLFADAIAAVHTLNWPVIEPERLAGVLARAHGVTDLSRRNWDAIVAETDDFRELVPSPRQTSLSPEARVTDDMVAAWRATLDRVDQVLDGELLLPHWRFAKGFDLRAYLETATRTDLVMILTGAGALPFLKDGPVADAESFRATTQAFGEDWLGYAFWFN